jgi:hypothetical protein
MNTSSNHNDGNVFLGDDRAGSTATELPDFPPPPDLHWGLVALLSVLSLGLFSIVWQFAQASWIKKLAPSSNVMQVLTIGVVMAIVGAVLRVANPAGTMLCTLGWILNLAGSIALIVPGYQIRRALLDRVGPATGGAMTISRFITFFFPVVYMQAKLNDITRWRQTGRFEQSGAAPALLLTCCALPFLVGVLAAIAIPQYAEYAKRARARQQQPAVQPLPSNGQPAPADTSIHL